MKKSKILFGILPLMIGLSLSSCDHYMSIDNGSSSNRHNSKGHTRSSHKSTSHKTTSQAIIGCSRSHSAVLKSLKKAPVVHYVITSKYGYRYHPITHKKTLHSGVDYATKHGTPIHATASGTLIFEGWKNGYGKTVILKHDNTYRTLYAHMDHFSHIKKGSHVKSNQVIGYVGETGDATGDHVHYEIQENGKPINPRC